MADIKIIVDSGSDIPQDIADKYNIGVISFLSIFGTEQYVQRTEITNEQFFDKLEEYDGIPTTSQTPFGDMLDYFKQQCEEHERRRALPVRWSRCRPADAGWQRPSARQSGR